MDVKIEPGWKSVLGEYFNKPAFQELAAFIKEEYRTQTVYPPAKNIFEAFNQCPFDNTKVVLLGQDPYHGPGQAHGLCFSVNDGVPFPPSLKNIFSELQDDLNKPIPKTGNLTKWANQGVFLLNTCLSVRASSPLSHQGKGWEPFTDWVITRLSEEKENLVFLLWGSPAQKKSNLIDIEKHLILTAAHPSPLSAYRGFMGCKHFSKTNAYLLEKGITPIQW